VTAVAVAARSGGTTRVEPVMGTVVSFDIRDPVVPLGALDAAVAWLHEVDARFSPFLPDSEISRIGDRTLAERDAHQDVRDVLANADNLAAESGGAFDARGWRADGRVDPCGIVKGWSIQVAADMLAAAGARAFAINAGGDIVARGGPVQGESWRVGVRHPDRPDRVAAVLAVRDAAVATSAAYERGAHIRDPRSGRAPGGVRSMTVVGPSLTWADAYATTAYVLGLEGLDWVAGHDGYEAFAITWDDTVRWTPGMDPYLVRGSGPRAC
jgi:thiamine biosynthesis lipoprotein